LVRSNNNNDTILWIDTQILVKLAVAFVIALVVEENLVQVYYSGLV
jgi:hypothetical protein